MKFTDKQIGMLQEKLDSSKVKPPSKYGPKGDYIEGWHAISEANRIFGFDAWSYEVLEANCVASQERVIGQNKDDGWGVTYTSKVRVLVAGVMREDYGAGHGYDRDLGSAHESAIKEAVTDALKRALRTFGNPFGLALYDKSRENVESPGDREYREKHSAAIESLHAEITSLSTMKGLETFWRDNQNVIKGMDAQTRKRFTDAKDALKKRLDKPVDPVEEIQKTFPGADVVNETVLDHPLMAGE